MSAALYPGRLIPAPISARSSETLDASPTWQLRIHSS